MTERGETRPLLESSKSHDASDSDSKRVSFHGSTKEGSSSRSYIRAFSYLQQWTESERQRALTRQGVGPAAFLICDALLGYTEDPAEGSFDPYHEDTNPLKSYISIKCRRIVTTRAFMKVVRAVSWLLVFLSFVEPPSWCRNYTGTSEEVQGCVDVMNLQGPPADNPEGKDVYYYPSTHTSLLTAEQSLIVSWACIGALLMFLLLFVGRDGLSLRCYLRKGPRQFVRTVQLVSILALLGSSIAANYTKKGRPVAHLFRIAVAISATRSTQRELLTVIRLLPEIIDVLFLLFIVILFYAWVGVMAFYETDLGLQHFPNLMEAWWTLWICVTTANYPDVMMPGYNENRWVAIYFVSFMIVTFFFFMNVILASVVNSYENQKEERHKRHNEIATADLKKAYRLMDPDETGSISRETVMALFLVLNDDFPQIPHINDEHAKLLFAVLDKDGSNEIHEDEFLDFANVMLLEFDRLSAPVTFMQETFPRLYNSAGYKSISRFVQSEKFEYTIDSILVLNAIVVAIQSYPMLVGQTVDVNPSVADGEIDTVWETVETAFTVIYCIEITSKILVMGWEKFSSSYRNLFDMVITVIAVLATAYVYYPNEYSDSRLIRYVVMARVLRLFRLLMSVEKFQIIGRTLLDIMPATSRVVLMLLCIMYVFAAFALEVFGGMITRDPSNPLSYRLLGNDFSDNDYWANNFNDMLGGMNVLFNLLVVNNWTECADGFEAVAQSKVTRLFFFAFHIIGVVVVNNVVIAVIINAFITQWDLHHEMELERAAGSRINIIPGEAIIGGERAMFDASEVTGTKTELSGRYIARIRKSRLGGHKKLLTNLFTRSGSSIDEDAGNGQQ